MSGASTDGYAGSADALAQQYESVTFDEVHAPVLHLLPAPPGRALDIGAGTGRDAAALARRGFAVTAVEPTAELRAHGERLHAGLGITWIDDSLPDLAVLRARPDRCDLVMLTAVWMHLDAAERSVAMAAIAGLGAPRAQLFVTLRHGPVPDGRRMFEVGAEETVALGRRHGFRGLHESRHGDMLGRPDVHWTHLVLGR
ncbi:class I SAM-dependent methyltransferase [Phreatobacter sp.]|uniref:class I SAM-dependent methyltransferase n=1 Tax=Phreatobacter sp. TaxID=1966341 RepID=UPI003F6ECC2C